MFSWLARALGRPRPAPPVPSSWRAYLDRNVALTWHLTEAEREALLAWTARFIPSVAWVGCGGLTVTEEMQVTIAAQAGLLVRARPEPDLYRDVSSILIYPSVMVRPPRPLGLFEQPRSPADQPTTLLGEAMLRGPLVLAWDAVLAGGHPAATTNVVLHEFAHKLDMATGTIDGAPPQPTRADARRWAEVCSAAYARHGAGVATALRPYGATAPAEFFAVATEAHFLTPHALADDYPALAELLSHYFGPAPSAAASVDGPSPGATPLDRSALGRAQVGEDQALQLGRHLVAWQRFTGRGDQPAMS